MTFRSAEVLAIQREVRERRRIMKVARIPGAEAARRLARLSRASRGTASRSVLRFYDFTPSSVSARYDRYYLISARARSNNNVPRKIFCVFDDAEDTVVARRDRIEYFAHDRRNLLIATVNVAGD